jgi:hypothetical protein
MNLQTQLKDIANRRKLDAIKQSFEAGHGKNAKEQIADQPQDLAAAETIKTLQRENEMMKESLK